MCSHNCRNTEGSFECSCFDGYKLHSDHKSCRAEGIVGYNLALRFTPLMLAFAGPEPLLIYSTTKQLKVITLRTRLAYPIFENLNHAVGVDYDSVENRMFWAEIDDNKEAVKSSKLDGTDVLTILSEGICTTFIPFSCVIF